MVEVELKKRLPIGDGAVVIDYENGKHLARLQRRSLGGFDDVATIVLGHDEEGVWTDRDGDVYLQGKDKGRVTYFDGEKQHSLTFERLCDRVFVLTYDMFGERGKMVLFWKGEV